MRKYSNIKKLIDWAEKFESQLSDGEEWDDENFASWLSHEVNLAKHVDTTLREKTKPFITMYIYFMYKYALFYSRKIFKDSLIYSIDDFSVLASLLPNKQLKKTDVIRKNISEKSSGNEVLKRLLRQKLIKETDNPNDKRSKLLELSPAGLNEINSVRCQLEKMGSLVAGDLNEQEKIMLLNMLSKLHDYHKPLFEANDEKLLNEKLGIQKLD
jgi:DNA-binding MarR family transcriptional regulator